MRSSALLWMMAAAPLWAVSEAGLADRLDLAGDNAKEIRGFVEAAAEAHGAFGEKAAVFLVAGMPERDLKSLDRNFLLENLQFALTARDEFPWAKELPENVFLNDVLPYASLDETRESWRPDFYRKCRELVKDCKTATEAAQAINKQFFNLIDVHYDTGRKAPNQSPSESIELGMATCTGLSIIFVDACRSVGVPARVAGTALWSNKRGNHTWAEVHDGGEWFFTGADEYNEKGLNRAWFVGDASKAIADDWRHAIWATSWEPADGHFPMVWSLKDKSVPAVNVTSRYAKEESGPAGEVVLYLRLRDRSGGERLALPVTLLDATGKELRTVTTKSGTADLNDMPVLKLKAGATYSLRVTREGEERRERIRIEEPGEVTRDLVWETFGKPTTGIEAVREWLALLPEERHLSVPEGALSRKDATAARDLIWMTVRPEIAGRVAENLEAKVVKAAGKEMKYLEKTFGQAPEGERSLWISMHGGGGAPARVNDQQWRNQIRLYAPEEGIVVAPRAPTNTWNLWHQGHIDELFDRLIASFVAARGVDPDRVYLMGYSAGGDGVYQLAPRMADRFAAAAMMAGHPNDASPLGLRNLPFMIFMGGNDGAYNRNKVAAAWGEKLAALRKEDATGYEHKVSIYEGLGHWMDGRDREALPWMAERTRNPWPKEIVWHQSGRTHERFYWLALPEGATKKGQTVRAGVDGQVITIATEGGIGALTLRLSDELLDLDQEVTVNIDGTQKFKGRVERSVQALWDSLGERLDPRLMATALVTIKP